jgi:GTP-binding protein YchF
MQTGIIGLPQVGKTSLFKILTHAHLDPKAAHAPTHIGVARVPDERLDKLAALYQPKKVTHAAVQYVDVGGLVKDRAKDSAFQTQVREVDALAHVVRVFEDPAVPHVSGKIDPLGDVQSLELELMLADLDQAGRRIERIERDLKKKADPALERELQLLHRCRVAIEKEQPLRELEFSAEERKVLTSFMFLSEKPMLYVLNLGDEEVAEIESAAERHKLGALAKRRNTAVVPMCCKIEAELADLDDAEAAEMLAAYGLKEAGLERLIHATYRLLGLISFFTCGEPEVRAWTIRRGTHAVKAAGEVHTDFERGFIKAEVVRWNDLLEAGSLAAAREHGKVKLEGKEYVVEEGDVVLFRHGG